jgi:hypothetical protein
MTWSSNLLLFFSRQKEIIILIRIIRLKNGRARWFSKREHMRKRRKKDKSIRLIHFYHPVIMIGIIGRGGKSDGSGLNL